MDNDCLKCPAVLVAKRIARTRYSYQEEIEFELYKAKRAKENRGYVPVFLPWGSYPYPRRTFRPLDPEEVDDEFILGMM